MAAAAAAAATQSKPGYYGSPGTAADLCPPGALKRNSPPL